MIVLLSLLGIAVGGAAEIYLRHQLYAQVDNRLNTALHPPKAPNSNGSPPGEYNNQPGGSTPQPSGGRSSNGSSLGFLGSEIGAMGILYDPTTHDVSDSRLVVSKPGTDGYYGPGSDSLTTAVQNQLMAIEPGSKTNIDIDGYGSYRAVAATTDGGDVRVVALPLATTNDVLVRVALFTGGSVLIALVIAGWTGAFIVRGTLRPLRRVAATATRVSELELDRGEVDLAQRVPEQDTDPHTEVGQVGSALNRMLDHVGSALEARHASEMQVRQFVADASHELRTPLAAIRGYAELSRRSRAPISEEIAHVLGRVESEAKRMTGLVEDLLLLARLDAGRPLAHDPVDLTMLVVDAVSDAHAAGPRHYWQLDLPEEPVTVIGDGARLHQVVANLLANARTHTPEGTTVTVAVRANDEAAVMHVIDSGPGIPPELQPHIFERFARGDSSRSRAAGSTGLGLSIVHAVVTSHRGTVSVQSIPGQTVFTVVLPIMPPVPVPTAGRFAQMAPRPR